MQTFVRMLLVRVIPILLLVTTLNASPRVRGSSQFAIQDTMTASMTSKHDYDVYENPVEVVVSFSEETESFEKDHCIVDCSYWISN